MLKKILMLVCIFSSAVVLSAENAGDRMDFSMVSSRPHPRLFMDNDDFALLKSKVNSSENTVLIKLHNVIMHLADVAMSDDAYPLEYRLDVSGRRILSISRNALSQIAATAYAYRLTGEKKYLDCARSKMEKVCSFPDWNHKHFLDVAEMALGMSVGYDWLYDDLSDQTKAIVEKALYEFAFKPSNAKKLTHKYHKMENNWNQVCNGGMTAAAIAVYEKYPEVAQDVIEKAVSSNREPMIKMYSPDGNYVEGYGYWNYGTMYEVLLLEMLEQTFGTDFGLSRIPGFMSTGDFMMFMDGICGCYCHSDCGPGRSPALAMWYFADKLDRPDLLFNELDILKKYGYRHPSDMRVLPLIMCFALDIDLDQVQRPQRQLWHGNGSNPVVLIRKDWTSSDSDAYLAVKGGMAFNNHGHMDAGSFVYDAFGVRWSHDLGMQAYAPLEKAFAEFGGNLWNRSQESARWTVSRYDNYHHSTVTLNDAHHNVTGMATIQEIIDSEKEKGVVLNMDEVFSGQAEGVERTVKLLEDNSLLVKDKVAASDTASVKYSWRMVTDASPDVRRNCIILEKDGVRMKLKASAGVRFEYRTWSAEPVRTYDTPNPGMVIVGVEAEIPAGNQENVTLLLSKF